MSAGTRLTFEDAYGLAEKVSILLGPTVEVLKVVGSLRRRRTTIGDLEFLARPPSSQDLFEEGPSIVHTEYVRAVMEGIGTWIKGGPRMMQITDLLGREGVHLELYLVHPPACACKDCRPWGPAAWGSMLAIRTGPEELSKYCVTVMRERGFYHDRGQVRNAKTREIVPTETEEVFFELAGVEFVPPSRREALAARLWAEYGSRRR